MTPIGSTRSTNKTTLVLIAAALIYVLIWGFFSPKMVASTDEYAYAKNAFLLGQGKIFVDEPTLYCQNVTLPSGKVASNYPIGKSLQLIPFALLERMDALFWAGLLTHLLNFFLLIQILRYKKVNPLWALIYLVFPAFQWESRTLYAELWLLTFYFGAYLAWIQKKANGAFVAGMLLGLGLFIRYDALLGLFAFIASAVWAKYRHGEKNQLLPLVAGAAIPLALVAAYNTIVFGSPFTTGYGSVSSLVAAIPLPQLISELATFPVLLFFVLPFSIWAANQSKADRVLMLTLSIITFLFFVRFYSFWALGTSIPQIFTVRLRYFIPLLGMLLIPTLEWYARHWNVFAARYIHSRSINRLIGIAVALVLIGGTIGLHATHDRFLQERSTINTAIHAIIPEDARIIGSADDCMHFLPAIHGKKYYVDVSTKPLLEDDRSTYVMRISYSTQENNGTPRQGVVDAQRQELDAFVRTHENELEKVHEDPRYGLTIWRATP